VKNCKASKQHTVFNKLFNKAKQSKTKKHS